MENNEPNLSGKGISNFKGYSDPISMYITGIMI